MFPKILTALVLVAVTVSIHAFGLAALLRALIRSHHAPPARIWPITWLLIRVAWSLIFIHGIEITVWALFYLWRECLPDAPSAFYFSGVTYTTIGYGDLLLDKPWRLFGPIEGLTGILMCGLSIGVFFVVVTRVFSRPFKANAS